MTAGRWTSQRVAMLRLRRGLATGAICSLGACAVIPADSRPTGVERIEDAVLPMARAALDAGQVQTAQRLYARLLEVDPDSAEARVGIGDVHMANREVRQAATWYRAAVDHARAPAVRHAALLAHARAALAAGEAEAARDSFGRLADPAQGAEDPEAAWGWNGIGVLHLLDGNARDAVAAFEQATLRDPGESKFHENLARAVAIVQQIPEPAAERDMPDGPLRSSSEVPAPPESAAAGPRDTAPGDALDAPLPSDDADAETPTHDPGAAPSLDGDAAAVPADEPTGEARKTWVGTLARLLRISRPSPPAEDEEDTASVRTDGPSDELPALDPGPPLDEDLPRGDEPTPLAGDDPVDATADDPESILADDRPDESVPGDPDTLLADDDIGQDDPPVPSTGDDAEDAIEEDTASVSTDGQRDESTAADLGPVLADDDLARDDAASPSRDADEDVRAPPVADDAEDATGDGAEAVLADDAGREAAEIDAGVRLSDDAGDDVPQDDLPVPSWDADEDVRAPPVADDAEDATGDGAEAVLADDAGREAAEIDAGVRLSDDAGDDVPQDDLPVPSWDADEDVRAPPVADDAEDATGDGAEAVLADDPGGEAPETDPDVRLSHDAGDDSWRGDLPAPSWDADEDLRAPPVADDAEDATGDGAEAVLADDPGGEAPETDPDVRLSHDAGDDSWRGDLPAPSWDADEDLHAPPVADDAEGATGGEAEPVLADDPWQADLAVPSWDADEDGRAPPVADDAGDATSSEAEPVPADDPWQADLAVPAWDADEDVRVPAVADDVEDATGDGVLEDMIGEARSEDDAPAWLSDGGPEDTTAQDAEVESGPVDGADSRSGDDLGPDLPDNVSAVEPTVGADSERASTRGAAVASGRALPTGFVVEADEGRFVQVGAYVVAVRADAVATRLRERTDLPVRIQPADRDGRLFYLVRIGPVPPGGMPEDLADELGIRRDAFAPLTAQALRIVSGGETYLQVGVYADRDSAERTADQAGAETGYPVEVRRMERRGRTPLYRVRVGPVEPADD